MDLKNERLRKNFTQQQLADLAEVDRTLISKLESGASSPSVETAKKIAKILDFDWTKFFEENSEQESEQEGA